MFCSFAAMKKLSVHTSIQKALALLMAAFVLLLAVMLPFNAQADERPLSQEQSFILDASSYTDAPDFSLLPEPLPKLTVLFFLLPKLWAMVLELISAQIREYRAVFLQFFIQKINFVFVSTLAP